MQITVKAHRKRGSIALLFFNLAIDGGGWPAPHTGRFSSGKSPVTHFTDAGSIPDGVIRICH